MTGNATNDNAPPTWASVDVHARTMTTVLPRSRQRCPYCPRSPRKRATHLGTCNGIAMMSGCEWHVRQWVRDPDGIRLPRDYVARFDLSSPDPLHGSRNDINLSLVDGGNRRRERLRET